MPGVCVTYSFRPDSGPSARAGLTRLFADARLTIDARLYDGYPLATSETARAVACLEGRVYGGRDAALLRALERDIPGAAGPEAFAAALRAEAEAMDGDFIAGRYDRDTGRLGIVGDRFGRVPLYYGGDSSVLVVSRDQRDVLAALSAPSIDRLALAQSLLFGYPLRSRTLVAGVHRLLPGEVIVAESGGVQVLRAPRSAFARTAGAPRTLGATARALCDAFVAGCRDRELEGHTNVLSLSGGIDSRTVGAGMRAAGVGFSAVTFAAPGSAHGDERARASAVATALGAAWRGYEFDHTDPACIERIIALKLGLSPVDVAFGLDYVARVQSDFGNPVALWTGEGADKLLCEHRALPRRARGDALVHFIVEKNAVLAPAHVVALTGVARDTLLDSIAACVADAGDFEPDDAYVHFLLSERVVRWHGEGEDRHREAVWPVAPFFARDFVALARAVPGEWKFGRRVYRAFLSALAPDVAALPLAGGHAAPASHRYALEYAVREHIRNQAFASTLVTRVRRRRASAQALTGAEWRRPLVQLMQNDVPECFARAELEAIVDGRVPVSRHALATLLTAVLAVRFVETARTSPVAS